VTDGIHVDDTGHGPAVLAIHGLGGGAYFFGEFAALMRDEHRIAAIDLPGTGRSATSSPYSMDTWVADLGDLVARQFDQPIVLLGHSMGTIVALKAWAAWPERIRALIFVGGLPRVRPPIHERLSARLETLRTASTLVGWGAKISPGVFSPDTIRNRPGTVAIFERMLEQQPLETYVRCCRILLESTADDVVATMTAPSLAVTGEDDQYAPPDAVAAFAQRLPRRPELAVLSQCGHLPFLEQPAEFAGVVKTFLRSC
jgi:pimeloyl-ACP methyl ester carboxylesterase